MISEVFLELWDRLLVAAVTLLIVPIHVALILLVGTEQASEISEKILGFFGFE